MTSLYIRPKHLLRSIKLSSSNINRFSTNFVKLDHQKKD